MSQCSLDLPILYIIFFHSIMLVNYLLVDPVHLFLSLSLKTVLHRKPPPIAILAVAVYIGHCPSLFQQWLMVA